MSRQVAVVGYYALLVTGSCMLLCLSVCVAGFIVGLMAVFAYANPLAAGLLVIGFSLAGVNIALHGAGMYRTGALSSKLAYPENGWQ